MPGAWMNPNYKAGKGDTDDLVKGAWEGKKGDEANMTGEELDARDRAHATGAKFEDNAAREGERNPTLNVLPKDVAPSPYGDSFNE